MTRRDWAILGTLAVAVLCVCGTLGFLVVRDMRKGVGRLAAAPTLAPAAVSPAATPQTEGAAPNASPASVESNQPAGGESASPAGGEGTEPPTTGSAGTSSFTGELPDDPLAATTLIQEQATALQSAHMVLDFSVQFQATPTEGEGSLGMVPFPEDIKIAVEGDFVNNGPNEVPDLQMTVRVQAEGESQTVEVVQVDGRQWANVDGMWEENEEFEEDIAGGGDVMADPISMFLDLQTMGTVERLPDETVDGVPTYHYRFSVDPRVFLQSEDLNSERFDTNMLMALFQDFTFEVEIWADQAQLWLRQEELVLGASFAAPVEGDQEAPSVTLQIDGLIKLSKHNEPVVIKPPL